MYVWFQLIRGMYVCLGTGNIHTQKPISMCVCLDSFCWGCTFNFGFVCFFPKALRRVLPENLLNTYISLTLEHLHFYTYNDTEVSK